jgi:purine-binding chemotaxis protein CheW
MTAAPPTGVDQAAWASGLVTFRVHGQWLGVPVARIQEVLAGQRINPVPLSPRGVEGFLNLRGRIVTAVDLRAVLDLPPRSGSRGVMNVVVQREEELFALVVDAMGDVLQVTEEEILPAPSTLDAVWRACCAGVVRMDEGLLVALDVDALLGGVNPD